MRGFDDVDGIDLGRVAQVEQDLGMSGNDVVRAGAGVDVRNLQAGRREKPVALVPLVAREFVQRRHCAVDRVVDLVRVGDMPLDTVDGQRAPIEPRRPFLTTSPTVSWLDGSPTSAQSIFSPRASSASMTLTVPLTATAFLVAGDQQRDRTLVIGVCSATKRSQAVTIAAMLDFMSAAPRP